MQNSEFGVVECGVQQQHIVILAGAAEVVSVFPVAKMAVNRPAVLQQKQKVRLDGRQYAPTGLNAAADLPA